MELENTQSSKKSISLYMVISTLLIGLTPFSWAQENRINQKTEEFPFTDANWQIEDDAGAPQAIKVAEYKGKNALLLKSGQTACLRDRNFENFRLEFYCNGQFPGLGFRIQDKENYEYLYLRVPMGGNEDALQYVPIYNGSLPWQLYNYPKYEGNATFPREQMAFLPLTYEDELGKGKANKKLLSALQGAGILFSEESFIDFASENIQYIYDPQTKKALIIEKSDKGIGFLDLRTWIHVKMEVRGDEMSIYIEDMDIPTFIVTDLKRSSNKGGISLVSDFDQVYFSDFSIEEIKAQEKDETIVDKTIDPNYLTRWRISEMFTKDSVDFLTQIDSLRHIKGTFKPVEADGDGLLNISRFYDDMTKTIALSCKLVSETKKDVALKFDYADHLVILMNSQVIFDEGMNFQPPEDKGKEGRVFVDDESVLLPLRAGGNELMFVLSGDSRQKFNWGVVAKLENLHGIRVEN